MDSLYMVETLEIDSFDGEVRDVEHYVFDSESDDRARAKAFGYAFQMKIFENGDVVYFLPNCDLNVGDFEISLQKANVRGELKEIDRASLSLIQEGLDFSLGFENSNMRINLSEYDESYGGYRKRVLEVQNGKKTK